MAKKNNIKINFDPQLVFLNLCNTYNCNDSEFTKMSNYLLTNYKKNIFELNDSDNYNLHECITYCIKYNKLDMLKTLNNIFDNFLINFSEQIIHVAIINNNIEILKWVSVNVKHFKFTSDDVSSVIIHESSHVMNWLLNSKYPFLCEKDLFKKYICNIDIIKIIFSKYPEMFSRDDIESLCSVNSDETTKFFLEQFFDFFTIDKIKNILSKSLEKHNIENIEKINKQFYKIYDIKKLDRNVILNDEINKFIDYFEKNKSHFDTKTYIWCYNKRNTNNNIFVKH